MSSSISFFITTLYHIGWIFEEEILILWEASGQPIYIAGINKYPCKKYLLS
jgi:hypothetical protein